MIWIQLLIFAAVLVLLWRVIDLERAVNTPKPESPTLAELLVKMQAVRVDHGEIGTQLADRVKQALVDARAPEAVALMHKLTVERRGRAQIREILAAKAAKAAAK
jgi:hypothetical protein